MVLFASYNRLQPGDEADSFAGLSLLRTEIIEPQIQKFGGRMIRWTGDEVLLEFESVVEAVCCAVALGEAVSQLNDSLRPDRRIALRIGINLADILVEGGEIFGDGVNIASRIKMQGMARSNTCAQQPASTMLRPENGGTGGGATLTPFGAEVLCSNINHPMTQA